jgi:cellulose synthase/poly-beta-1,6-N-acetylglucosamine synthase-like glycosyltransferase
MDILFFALQVPFLALGFLLSLYLLILTLAPYLIPKRKKQTPSTKKKFAIIIPAHNEETVIQGTLRSALHIAYPKELFDVIVVADNCTDQTAKIALACGAIVFQRVDTTKRGKGYALNWIVPQVLERLPAPGYDACVVVDADSVISSNFLEEMNISLQEGHRIIQSSDLVLDNSNSWRVQLMLIAFALQNYVRPLGKSRLGLSALLKGNGMCFAVDVVRKLKWDEASLGEDLDMSTELIRQGERIHFNPDPVVYAIMPEHASGAATQRIRWEGGRFASMKNRVPGVLKEAWKKKSVHIFEAALDAAFPPLALLLLGSGVFVLLNALLVSMGWVTSKVMLWGWGSVIAMMVIHCVLGLMLAKVHPRNLLAFLYVPRYLIWKIGVYRSMLAGKATKAWVRTER